MSPPLLHLDDIRLTFGGTPLLEGASLMVHPQDRICLVGRNGSGKSTLLKIAAGEVEADSGRRFLQPGTTLRYLTQEPDLSAYPTLGDFINAGGSPTDDAGRLNYLMDALKISAGAAPDTVSGGEARRAAIVRALAPRPDILLLDEPTNHLDLPAIEWLEGELASLRSAIVLISHDRRFLETLSRKTVWLDRGRTSELEFGFGKFEDWRDKALEEEEQARHKLGRRIEREQHWIVHGVSGRRKRNMRRVHELADMRQRIATERRATGSVALEQAEAGRSGKLVAELEGVSKNFGGRPIVKDLSTIIRRGDRLGIVGPNGAGKTTLVRLITGELAPDSGKVRLGVNLQPLTVDQNRSALNPEATLRDILTDGSDMIRNGDTTRHLADYMKDFLFSPEQAGTPVSALSGGERARLLLARGLAHPSNLLVLDEPTNDLDLETLDLLQEFVADYSGTAIVVSHDRDFLDRVSTQVLAFEGNGVWREYAGGYSDMVAQRGAGVRPRESGRREKHGKSGKSQEHPPEPERNRQKLSFKQRHALDTLPGEIEKLETEIAKLQKALSDPELYSRDRRKFDAYTKALEERQRLLAEKEEQWLELEALREQAEG